MPSRVTSRLEGARHRWMREERENLVLLHGLLGTVGSTLDPPQVLARILQASRRLLGTERNLILLKENGDALVPRAWDGFDSQALEGVRLSAAGSVFGRSLMTRRPVRLEIAAEREPETMASELAGLRSGLMAALRTPERVLGVLLVGTAAIRPFSRTDENLLRVLADHGATAIDHAQRYQEAMTRGERLAKLLQFSQRVAAHRLYDDLLPLIAEEAKRVLGATAAAFRLVDGDELAMAVCAGRGENIPEPVRLRIGEGLCGRVAATGRPIRVDDTSREDLPDPATCARLVARGIRSYLGVPLLVRERVTGVLSVFGADPDRFTDDDLALLSGFAGQAAVALENAGLVQELLHAERLSAVGRIVAGVAHELNNPLAVVVGTAELLQREGVDARVADRLQRISGQAQRAVKIVRSLLALARKKPAQRSPLDINALLDRILELEAEALRGARITVVRQFTRDLRPVLGDADQLQQVFTNLLLNASEAMREAHGAGTLTLATRRDERTDRVAITVADDGPGIQPRDTYRIFEPFFTLKGKGKGTGLGLAICRQIVDSHGGRITVESQPGSGATFTVELPAARVVERGSAESPRHDGGVCEGVNVLLVEDDRIVGDLLAEFLGRDGHHVDRAANGREALERVTGRSYGLIVSDVRMPDVDGPGLYQGLLSAAPDLARRMVFVTGDVVSPETRRFLDESGLSYLEKPFDLEEFQAVIRAVLSDGGSPAVRPV